MLLIHINQLDYNKMQEDTVRIYVRNSQKFAKVLTLPVVVHADQLYTQAATAHKLTVEQINLHFDGRLLPTIGTVTLYEKAIIHLVNKQQVNVQQLSLQIFQLGQGIGPIKYTTDPRLTVRQFIDGPLFESLGLKSDKLFLVYLGRRLKLEKTFLDQDVENDSEIISVSLDYIKKQHQDKQQSHNLKDSILSIHQLETPRQPKDVYPTPDFPINVPQDVYQKDSTNFVFDSKLRLTGSRSFDLQPAQVIQEEEVSNSVTDIPSSSDLNRNSLIGGTINREEEEAQAVAVRDAVGHALTDKVATMIVQGEGEESNLLLQQVDSPQAAEDSKPVQFDPFDDLI